MRVRTLRLKTQAALPQQKRFLFPFVFMVLRFGEKRLYLRNNLLAFLAASHNKYTRLNGRAARRRVSGNTVAQGKRERERKRGTCWLPGEHLDTKNQGGARRMLPRGNTHTEVPRGYRAVSVARE